ncbi:hypothetical protein JRI60_38430 [Archangium violaceum]|uniref:hypothetical protein n=1 Tax=Archangium violaceum TaxID=83451 RepID=UPI0019511C48|nr:hypothetical protein [Archangium violaceum]QRN94939.1 hypothetical protein JRI60_38430 [Archangium violaceum]
MKILFLNLAGEKETANETALKALRKKYPAKDTFLSKLVYGPSTVTVVDVWRCYGEVRHFLSSENPDFQTGTPEFNRIKQQVDTAMNAGIDKIMLSVHGNYDDVTHGSCKLLSGTVKISYLQLYELFMMLVEDRYKASPLKLTLVMCYGGRARDYLKSHAPENLGTRSGPDLTTSFAFQFYSLLCKQMKVTMTARTGALSFDDISGHSKVESERLVFDIIERDLRRKALGNDEEAAMGSVDFSEYLEELFSAAQASEELLPTLESKAMQLKQTHQQPLQQAAIDFQHQQTKVNLIKDPETKSKYGKLVFKYDEKSRTIQIWSKYPLNRLVAQKSV